MCCRSALSIFKDKGIAPVVAADDSRIYLSAAVFCSILGAGLLSLGFFKTEERVRQSSKAPTVMESFRYLFGNKPLMLVALSSLLAFPRTLQVGITVYIADYMLGGKEWVMILSFPGMLGMVIASAFVPKLINKIGLAKLYVWANLVSMIPLVLLYFVSPQNTVLMIAMLVIAGIPGGVLQITPMLLVADCVDYAEWKNGERSEGISFSVSTFISKASSAFQGVTIGVLLSAFGFMKPLAAGEILPQSAKTLNGMWAMNSLFPALGSLICVIPMAFYMLKGKRLDQMRGELAVRRQNSAIILEENI